MILTELRFGQYFEERNFKMIQEGHLKNCKCTVKLLKHKMPTFNNQQRWKY